MNRKQYEFLLEAFGFCCISETSLKPIIDVMRDVDPNNEERAESSYYTETASHLNLHPTHVELILEFLDSKELTEHGSSVRGSWLTKAGIAVLAQMDLLESEGEISENDPSP